MRRSLISRSLLALLLSASFGAVQAQGAASAPGPGARMGPGGMGMGMGMQGMRMGRDNTSGWSMMTSEERKAHHDKMAGMKDYAECHAYMEQHHTSMMDRAKERGRTMPSKPRHDACAPLKK